MKVNAAPVLMDVITAAKGDIAADGLGSEDTDVLDLVLDRLESDMRSTPTIH